MKRILTYIAATCVAAGMAIVADNYLWINTSDGTKLGIAPSNTEAITPTGSDIVISAKNGQSVTLPRAEILRLTPGEETSEVVIDFTSGAVSNPLAFNGVSITREGTKIVVTSSTDDVVTYRLTGKSSDGAFKLYSAAKYNLIIDNLDLTSSASAAINSQSKKKGTVTLIGDSRITDSKKYTTAADEDEKGCFFAEGKLEFVGEGSLTVTANKKHGIVSDKTLEISEDATITIASASSDGIHVNDGLIISGGNYICENAGGDGIDADTGYIEVKGGSMRIVANADDSKCIKSDSTITVTGGIIDLNCKGAMSKGIRSKQLIAICGGEITATLTGDVQITDGDPSYCSAFKAQDFIMEDGTITINHSGFGGKGISVDGDAHFSGGNVEIITTGDGGTYVDVNGDNDSYSSTCITIDGNLALNGGTFRLSSSGTAGKCIKVDGNATFGGANTTPVIEASTSGGRIRENAPAANAPGGWNPGGGWGPGGGGNSADYANPKVIKVQGELAINKGDFTLNGTTEGGEGLESKTLLTINGGLIRIVTYDDAINCTGKIIFNGGCTFAQSTGNDGVDSNASGSGAITINGGVLIAVGQSSPECGLDCDNNAPIINGGTVFAIGGDNSKPTASTCKQPTITYSKSLSKGTMLTITDASTGRHIISFTQLGATVGSMIITSPSFVSGSSYNIYTGGTITGGNSFVCLTTSGSYVPGTKATTFTCGSSLANVGGTSGGR